MRDQEEVDDNQYQPIVGNGWSASRTRAERGVSEEDKKGLATGGWLKAGGVSAAANRNDGLPTYVRYSNASRKAD